MRKILALLILLAIPAVAQFGGPMGGMGRPGAIQGGGLLPGLGGDPLWVAAGPVKPTFDLPLAKRKDLTDAVSGKTSLVTFSRSAAQSPGTYVGSDGLIHNAAVNLALYSEQFDNAAWIKENASILANQTVAPDGKQTADKIVATANSGTHRVYDLLSPQPTLSVYAKAAELDYVFIRGGGTSPVAIAVFNLATATLDYQQNTLSTSIESIGNGWFRVSMTGVTSFQAPNVGVADSSYSIVSNEVQFTGDGTSGIYIWGAQLQEGATATPYVHTTSQALAAPRFDHDPTTGESLGLLVEEQRTNLWTYSGDPNDSSWLLFGATRRTTSPIAAPDGTSISTVFDFGVAGNRAVYKVIAASGDNTVSAYLRTESGTETMYLTLNNGSDIYSQPFTVTDEWQRFSFTLDTTGGTGVVAIRNGAAGGAKSVYVWGVQYEAGAFPTSYIPTTSSAQTRYADVAAVQDEDFSTTNLLAYSESFDVGWLYPGTTATVTANATVAPDGQLTADLIEAGATGASNYLGVSVSGSGGSSSASVYVKRNTANWIALNFGSSANTAWFNIENAVTGTINGSGSHTIQDVGNGWLRLQLTQPLSAAGFFLYIVSADNSFSGNAGDSVYLWGASLTATEYPVAYTTTRNLLTDSQDFERASWVAVNTAISNDDATSPDGTLTADKIIPSAVSGAHDIHTFTGVISGEQYTLTVYAKPAGYDYISLFNQHSGTGFGTVVFDVQGGTVVAAANGASVGQGSISSVGNGWFRAAYTFTATATSSSSYTGINSRPNAGTGLFSGNASDGAYLYGAQLEPGTTATDYVRTVDVVGKAYRWYEPTEGTVFADYAGQATFDYVVNFGPAETIYMATNAFWMNGSPSLYRTNTALSAKRAIAFELNNAGWATNGVFAGPYTSVGIPIPNSMQLGSKTTGNWLNGHIKRLTYWPVRQSDSTLQVITQ